MTHVVVSAREDVVVEGSAPALELRAHRFPSRLHQLELDRPLVFCCTLDRYAPGSGDQR